MSQDFSDLLDDDFESDAPIFADEGDNNEDLDMDGLRRQSVRSGSAFDDMEMDVDDSGFDDGLMLDDDGDEATGGSSGSRYSLRNFTPMQRLILGLLFLLNIGAIAFGVLVVMGIVS